MALQYSPKIVTDGLVMCLDPSQNKSYGTTDLPVKGGLLVWLDASDDSTFSYSSGTEVSQWRDKSGNNFHANQATTANQPSRNSFVNSRRGVNFTSVNGDFMRVSSGIVTPNYITLFAVVRPATQDNNYAIIMEQDHGNGYNGWVIQRNNNISYWQSWVAGNAVTWLNPNQIAYTDNTSQIITLRKTSSTINLYSNGTSSGAVSISDSTITQSSYGLNLGYWQYGGGRYYNGVICEILVFNRGLSDVELRQVNTYLGQKWGIANTDRSIIDLSGFDDNGLLGNGTTANMPVYDYYNKGGLKFDGSNDYVSIGANASLQSNNVSIGIFFKTINNGQAVQFMGGYGDTGNYGYWIGTAGTDLRFKVGNGTTALQITSGIVPNNDQIYYAVGTYDGTSQKIYVDGILKATGTTVTGNMSYTGMTDGFLLGQVQGFTAGRYMTGNIYHTHVYNRALSAVEVSQNYEVLKTRFANTIIQQGLALNLDAGNPYSYAGAGTTWFDVSGNAFNATLINSPTYTTDNGGVLNWASASSQYATVSMNSTLRVANITQEVWVYLSTTADQVFIGSQYGTGSNNSFALWIQSGTFTFGVNTGGNFYYSTSSSASSGIWYHLVHTYNGTTQYLYINGVQTTSNGAASGNISYDLNNTLLAIAADFNGTGYNVGPTVSVNGKMPVVRIYNIALSAAQVLQNYNATKGRFGL